MRGPPPGFRRPRRAPDACPGCGQTYAEFRTGLTFAEVRRLMWSPGEPAEWRYRTRRMVLGMWNQLKRQLWHDEHGRCEVEMRRKRA